MNPSPTNSAIAAAAKVQRYTLDPDTQLSYQPSLPFIREDADGEYVLHSDYAALLAKLAEVEAEAVTSRLALALWMNGSTPNQPLIDDIERWRQEVAARVYQDEAVKAALTRAEQSDVLLARAVGLLRAIGAGKSYTVVSSDETNRTTLMAVVEDIDNHLVPKETT